MGIPNSWTIKSFGNAMTNKLEEGRVICYPKELVLTSHLYTPNKELPILNCIEMPLMVYTIDSTSRDFWRKK